MVKDKLYEIWSIKNLTCRTSVRYNVEDMMSWLHDPDGRIEYQYNNINQKICCFDDVSYHMNW
jgi:hypothetical protein